MLTLISGTNRSESYTRIITEHYHNVLKDMNIDHCLWDLCAIDLQDSLSSYYMQLPKSLIQVQEELLIPAEKFIIITPEYNGSYSGIFKLLIDLLDSKSCWNNKKALLTGVSTGRAGNLRGMDHLAATLEHMHCFVHPYKFPISNVHLELDENKKLKNENTCFAISTQINSFINW